MNTVPQRKIPHRETLVHAQNYEDMYDYLQLFPKGTYEK